MVKRGKRQAPLESAYQLSPVKHIGGGVSLGFVASIIHPVLSATLLILVGGCLLLRFLYRGYKMPHKNRPWGLLTLGIMASLMGIATILPVKNMDRMVPPSEYKDISLYDLVKTLKEEHGVICNTSYYPEARQLKLSFEIPEAMSRREVLHKLAAETGWDLQISYCGTSGSLLYGFHPSFTRLGPPTANSGNSALTNL